MDSVLLLTYVSLCLLISLKLPQNHSGIYVNGNITEIVLFEKTFQVTLT